MNERVLIIAAHPDDDVLGCGGVMARHSDRDDVVDVLFVADGVSSREHGKSGLDRRRAAARKAADIVGARPPRFLDMADNRLDEVALLDIVQAIERVVSELDPSIVYTHHGGDLNIDHRIVHQAAVTALRPLPARRYRGLYAFEALSSTEWATPSIGSEFRPDRFVDIEASMKRKLAALEAYAEEMRPFPHARSYEAVKALAILRGTQAGLAAAEAFVTLRSIERGKS